jgi:hypothetical protein
VRRLLIALIVLICLGAPVVEMFDQWDHTAQDGADTEADAVIVVLCVGAGVLFAAGVVDRVRASALTFQRLPVIGRPILRPCSSCLVGSLTASGSPPGALRI